MKNEKSITIIFTLLIAVTYITSCSKETPNKLNIGGNYFYLGKGKAMDVDIYPGDGIMYNCSLLEDPIVFPEIENYKSNDNFIVCKQNYNKILSSTLLSCGIESRFRRQYYSPNEIKTYPAIANYIPKFLDDSFIDSLCKKISNNDKILFSKTISDSILSTNQLFLKMKKQKINYYIIDKRNKNKYLILSRNEFYALFKKLRIPDSLQLN